MKTLQYLGGTKIGIGEKPIPQIDADEVLIKVAYCGICGTDQHIAKGMHPRAKAGLTMGHEFSGIIEKVGSKTNFQPGDRVVVEPLISCGTCYACKSGAPHVCQQLGLYGIDQDGGFAEYVKVKADRTFEISQSISLKEAALIEPMAVGIHAVRRSGVQVQDNVLVIGGGPIGFFVSLAAREAGAHVYISEINPNRKKLLKSFGFKLFDADLKTASDKACSLNDGKGFDVVFDVAGAKSTMLVAEQAVRVRGRIVIVAVAHSDMPFSYCDATFKEISFTGTRVYEFYDFKRTIDMFSSLQMDLSPIYSVFSLDEYQEAFDKAAEGDTVMRSLIRLGGDL
jgi:2-desacetyl-2-hydroxyethyl bacteriochlorophyllide A dehydrogenase